MKKSFSFTKDRKDKIKRFLVNLKSEFDSLNEKEKEEFLNKLFNPGFDAHKNEGKIILETLKKGLES